MEFENFKTEYLRFLKLLCSYLNCTICVLKFREEKFGNLPG